MRRSSSASRRVRYWRSPSMWSCSLRPSTLYAGIQRAKSRSGAPSRRRHGEEDRRRSVELGHRDGDGRRDGDAADERAAVLREQAGRSAPRASSCSPPSARVHDRIVLFADDVLAPGEGSSASRSRCSPGSQSAALAGALEAVSSRRSGGSSRAALAQAEQRRGEAAGDRSPSCQVAHARRPRPGGGS